MQVPALLGMSHNAPAKDPTLRRLEAAELDVQRLPLSPTAANTKLRERKRLHPPMAVSVPDWHLRPPMAVPVPYSRQRLQGSSAGKVRS